MLSSPNKYSHTQTNIKKRLITCSAEVVLGIGCWDEEQGGQQNTNTNTGTNNNTGNTEIYRFFWKTCWVEVVLGIMMRTKGASKIQIQIHVHVKIQIQTSPVEQ